MARRFRKKAGIGIVSLPGVAGLGNDTIVEGDEYARFCPVILEEVFDEVSAPAPAPTPEPAPAPAPAPAPTPAPEDKAAADEPVPSAEAEGEEELEAPSLEWKKVELAAYAGELGIDTAGMTKQQLLDAIEAFEEAE